MRLPGLSVLSDYGIYSKNTAEIKAIKLGFCWPAFFFTVFWMFWHRLWWESLVWVVIRGLLGALGAYIDIESEGAARGLLFNIIIFGILLILEILYFFIPGFFGNAWRSKKLLRQGYVMRAKVSADTIDQAIHLGNKTYER